VGIINNSEIRIKTDYASFCMVELNNLFKSIVMWNTVGRNAKNAW